MEFVTDLFEIKDSQTFKWTIKNIDRADPEKSYFIKSREINFFQANAVWFVKINSFDNTCYGVTFYLRDDGNDENSRYKFRVKTNKGQIESSFMNRRGIEKNSWFEYKIPNYFDLPKECSEVIQLDLTVFFETLELREEEVVNQIEEELESDYDILSDSLPEMRKHDDALYSTGPSEIIEFPEVPPFNEEPEPNGSSTVDDPQVFNDAIPFDERTLIYDAPEASPIPVVPEIKVTSADDSFQSEDELNDIFRPRSPVNKEKIVVKPITDPYENDFDLEHDLEVFTRLSKSPKQPLTQRLSPGKSSTTISRASETDSEENDDIKSGDDILAPGRKWTNYELMVRIRNIYLVRMKELADTSSRLLVAAARNNYSQLLSESCQSFAAHINITNFPEIWKIATELEAEELKRSVIKYLILNSNRLNCNTRLAPDLMIELVRSTNANLPYTNANLS